MFTDNLISFLLFVLLSACIDCGKLFCGSVVKVRETPQHRNKKKNTWVTTKTDRRKVTSPPPLVSCDKPTRGRSLMHVIVVSQRHHMSTFQKSNTFILLPCVGPSRLLYRLQSLRRVRRVCYGRQLTRVKWHDGLQICVALNIVRNPPFQSLNSLNLQGCGTAATYCVTEWNVGYVCTEDTAFSQRDANRTWRNYSEL